MLLSLGGGGRSVSSLLTPNSLPSRPQQLELENNDRKLPFLQNIIPHLCHCLFYYQSTKSDSVTSPFCTSLVRLKIAQLFFTSSLVWVLSGTRLKTLLLKAKKLLCPGTGFLSMEPPQSRTQLKPSRCVWCSCLAVLPLLLFLFCCCSCCCCCCCCWCHRRYC